MEILFMTLAYPENGDNLYTDLTKALAAKGHQVYVVCPRERRNNLPTQVNSSDAIKVLRVQTPNITQTNIFEKAYSTLVISAIFERAVKTHYCNVNFDLILIVTPPITFNRLVRKFKTKFGAKVYLMLKDIFPQNAVDIGLMKKGLIWSYFRRIEKDTYGLADFIGTMSSENRNYLIRENPGLSSYKVEICPNCITPKTYTIKPRDSIRAHYGVLEDEVLLIYGGNLGKPQGIDFLLQTLNLFSKNDRCKFFIIGSGTEYSKVQEAIQQLHTDRIKLMHSLPQIQYRELLFAADVGLVFLDYRFTIPNFPSRINDYLEASLPLLAATDIVTDIRDLIEENGLGLWVESNNLNAFSIALSELISDGNLRRQMGLKGRKYMEEHFTAKKASEVILEHFKRNGESAHV